MTEILIDKQRDQSIKATEITIVRDDGFSDAVEIKFYDTGKITTRVWTVQELGDIFQSEISEAVKLAYKVFEKEV